MCAAGLRPSACFQQADAVRDGVVDMVYSPGSFYAGALPEKDALVASNRTAAEGAREWRHRPDQRDPPGKDGGELPRLVRFGVCYNLWMVNEPQFDADGNLSMTDIKPARQPGLQRLLHQLSRRAGDRPADDRGVRRRWSAASSTPPAGPRSA
jgi:hypothetical protein